MGGAAPGADCRTGTRHAFDRCSRPSVEGQPLTSMWAAFDRHLTSICPGLRPGLDQAMATWGVVLLDPGLAAAPLVAVGHGRAALPQLQHPAPRHQTLVKHWPNTGQILVKYWSSTGQSLDKHGSSTGQALVKHGSAPASCITPSTLAKNWSNSGQRQGPRQPPTTRAPLWDKRGGCEPPRLGSGGCVCC